MRSRRLAWITVMTSFAALAVPVCLAAQDNKDRNHHEHYHYKLIDMGTFGGPSSFIHSPENFILALNRRGTTVGGSGTTVLTTSTNNPTAFCGGGEGLNPAVYQPSNGRTVS